MSTVTYNPESAKRAFLPNAGTYGPGCEHEADVTIFEVALAEPGSLDAPFDDKECEKDSYTVWQFQVVHQGVVLFARSRAQANTLPNMGSKNIPWLNNLGVVPTGDEDGYPRYDLSKLSGIKCAIRVAAPRQNKKDPTEWFTGAVIDVFSVQQGG